MTSSVPTLCVAVFRFCCSGDDMIVGPRTVVFAHLTASAMRSVAPRLEECVQAGARVITYVLEHPRIPDACAVVFGVVV